MASAITVTRRSAALALGLLLLPAGAPAATTTDCGAPADLYDDWQIAAPAAGGLDPKLICAIGPALEKMKKANPNGVVIVRHGMLVYEHYFTGKDERWPELHLSEPPRSVPHNANTLHDLQSVTKSVTAILVGIAFDRGGYLKSLDAPVLSFFPQYADLRTPGKERITLRDLLSMTSGLFWSGGNIAVAPNPYRLVLNQPLAAVPGTARHYNSGGVEVIGAILKKVSGEPMDQFAKKGLFDPLGITDWQWGRLANGEPAASWGLRLRPRDLAKIGQLVLNRGTWHGRRIVSAAWIKEMTAPHSSPANWVSGVVDAYGYLWWLGHKKIDNRKTDWVAGLGWGDQRVYVIPSEDLVVVTTAGAYRTDSHATGIMALNTALRAALGN